MKKHFNITKSTPECQRLVALYSNMALDTDEAIKQNKEIFSQIKKLILPQSITILKIACFDYDQTAKTINSEFFHEFLDDALRYYLNTYEPSYYNGYKKSAHFDTYFSVCLNSQIHLFFKTVKISEYYENIQKENHEKYVKTIENERLLLAELRSSTRQIVKLNKNATLDFLKQYDNIAHAEKSECKEGQDNTFVINLGSVLNGKAKTAKGCKWMYLEDYKKLSK